MGNTGIIKGKEAESELKLNCPGCGIRIGVDTDLNVYKIQRDKTDPGQVDPEPEPDPGQVDPEPEPDPGQVDPEPEPEPRQEKGGFFNKLFFD